MESIDTILELMNESRRRYALYYLDEQDESVPVGESTSGSAKFTRGRFRQPIRPR